MQKKTCLLIILILLLLFSPYINMKLLHNIITVPSNASTTQDHFSYLVIYNDANDNNTIQQLLKYRPDISLNNLEFVNWLDNNTLTNILTSGSYTNYKEFWFVVGDFNNANIPKGLALLLPKLLETTSIRGLILTPFLLSLLEYVPFLQTFNLLGIQGCSLPTTLGLSNFTVRYPLFNSLSNLIGVEVPSNQTFRANFTYSGCTLRQNAYKVAELSMVNNNLLELSVPIVFQVYSKAPVVIGSFSLYSPLNNAQLLIDTAEIQVIKSEQSGTNFIKLASLNSPVQKSNTNLLSIMAILASGQTFAGLSNTGSLVITIGNFSLILPQWIFPTTIVVSLLGGLIYLIRRLWIIIAGMAVFIGTLIYHPSRKLDTMEVLGHNKRQKIMDILNIQAEHGETFRNLSQKLKMPVPTLLWHLKILEDFSLIETVKIRREIVIIGQNFVKDFDPVTKELELSFKSSQAQLFKSFLNNLKPNQTFTFKDVLNYTKWNNKTAQKHIDHLCSLKIINKADKQKIFTINQKYISAIKSLQIETSTTKYEKNKKQTI